MTTIRTGEVDRKNWEPGPWDAEPDYVHWVDETTGLDCLAVRHQREGFWCGYAGVPTSHPLHGLDGPPELEDVRVHGGLTFAGGCRGRICHKSERGEVWWFGFDCNHAWDCTPASGSAGRESDLWETVEYRTLDYVREHATALAGQLAEVAKPCPDIPPPETP